MERNILIGNGINIQFGAGRYSNSAIMKRAVENIKTGKYNELVDNALSVEEQLGLFEGLVDVINSIKKGGYQKYADGLFMLMELERIKRTYPETSTVESVFLEDYFLAAELFNNRYREKDGEAVSEQLRKYYFDYLRRVVVDAIYDDGNINNVYSSFYPRLQDYLKRFTNIFTVNYDYNLEKSVLNSVPIIHLHGEFDRLSPEYDRNSTYYQRNKAECESLIQKKVSGLDHIYGNEIMSWSWLDKYSSLDDCSMRKEKEIFESIEGQLEILGLSPANDSHLFLEIQKNSKIKSIVFYYFNDSERDEIKRAINKPITFKKVQKLWESLK